MIIEWILDNFNKLTPNILKISLKGYQEIIKDNNIFDAMICEIPYWNTKHNITEYTDSIIDELLNNFKCRRYVFIVKQTKKYLSYINNKILKSTHLYRYTKSLIVIDK